MKKSLLILLLFSYTVSSWGIGVKRFYCCGKLKTTGISLRFETKAECTSADEGDGCCKTTVQTYKVDDSHFAADHIDIPLKYFADIASYSSATIAPVHVLMFNIATAIHGPPDYKVIPLNILHCVYRI